MVELEWIPVHNLTGASTVYTASTGTGAVTITSNTSGNLTTDPYLIQAAEWGRQAGEQWCEDVRSQWVTESYATSCGSGNWSFVIPDPPVLTPEQAEASGRSTREYEYKTDRAKWRAEDLLLRNLTPRQVADYLELGRFTVRTGRGHRYVIGKSYNQNVVRVNKRGKPMRVYCVTVHGVPLEDRLLGQKLMLEHDEDHFLRVARQWPLRFALGVGDLIKKSSMPPGWTVSDLTTDPVIVNGERLVA